MKRAIILIAILLLPSALAEDMYISNSASWQNVYSAGLFSALQGKEFKFLVSAKHTEVMIAELPKQPTKITVIESDKVPYSRRYANRITNSGRLADTILIPEQNGNLDLAKRLPEIKNYIIVDPTFGYDAISATPYAINTKSYVLFANKDNINEIAEFLKTVQPSSVTLFGNLDGIVTRTLSDFNPRIINQKNRFENNIAIAEELRSKTTAKQAILTNGEFIEQDIFSVGHLGQPIIFIGKDKVPKAADSYVKTSPYQVFVVLGNDLFGSAQTVRQTTGKQVLIKFAKGTTTGGYKNVQGLDIFPTPQLILNLAIESIFYNADQQRVDMTIRNEEAAKTFAQHTLIVQNGETPIVTLGDDGTELSGHETRTYSYPEDLSNYVEANLTAQIALSYGESEDTIEKLITATLPIPVISEKNVCNLDIKKAVYNKETQRIKITVEADKPCYVQITLPDLTINDTKTSAQSEITYLENDATIEIKQRMDKVDLADNKEININARQGSQKTILIKQTNEKLPLKIEGGLNIPLMIGIAAIILLITLIILVLWKRKSKQ
jgi:hypothetical protein